MCDVLGVLVTTNVVVAPVVFVRKFREEDPRGVEGLGGGGGGGGGLGLVALCRVCSTLNVLVSL